MAKMTAARTIVGCLRAHGVDTIFGIIATHTVHIYDALYDYRDSIRFIGGRHEHAVGFMADGYSRATGRPGVFLTSGGPGAANSMGPMGEAYAASSALLQITTYPPRGDIHETKDQAGMFRAVTGWNALIEDVATIPDHFLEAFNRFKSERPRPIELEINKDYLSRETDLEILPPLEVHPTHPDPAAVEQAAEAIRKSRRPLIWVGGGIVSAGATSELQKLAETLGAPVFLTATGKGAIPQDHPLCLGAGRPLDARGENLVGAFMDQSDLVLLIGSSIGHITRLSLGQPSPPEPIRLPSNVIQIDIDPAEIGKAHPIAVGMVGDAKIAIQQLLSQLERKGATRNDGYLQEVSQLKTAIRQSLMRHYPNELKTMEGIRGVLDQDAIIVGEASMPALDAIHLMPVYRPRTFWGPFSWGGLGMGLPSGLGAKVACPGRQVVVLTGDGGFQFNIQELGTAVQYGISPVVIIFNDNAWGALKQNQERNFNGRTIATELRNPDFVKLAEAYGATAAVVHTGDQLTEALRQGLRSKVIHLIVAEMPQGFANFA